VLWELSLDAVAFADVLAHVAAAGADWFFIPATVAAGDVPLLVERLRSLPSANVVLGVTAAEFVSRTRRAEVERLDALRPLRCAAMLVQSAGPSEMKSGGPFHRLNNLRNAGRCDFVFAEAETVADGEWMIGNTPAHAVVLPFGVADQTARFRVLAAAEELGTAVIVRTPHAAAWDAPKLDRAAELAFALSHPAVAMVVEPLPVGRVEASGSLAAASRLISDAERDEIWKRFRAVVKEPPKPRGNHPPEYGA
jgi:hypothetical protein